ncbi:transmembrane protein 80 isoform X2 [Salmo salar]|uniref:Transmembrane protein 216 n=1 Tax=Salmo salar TaxID=8030 RepID=A0ABM3F7I0_SALSA|nr:transmembrane protein 80 isoform X2 [Salmo salar]
MAVSGKHTILSSTPLQVLFYLNGWYFAAYFLAEGLMFVYKGLLLPYPPASLTLDVGLLLVFLGLESLRIFYVWRCCWESCPYLLSPGQRCTKEDECCNVPHRFKRNEKKIFTGIVL